MSNDTTRNETAAGLAPMASISAEEWERRSWCNVSPSGLLLLVNQTEEGAKLNQAEATLPAYRNGTARPMTPMERAADSRRPEYDPKAAERLSAAANARAAAQNALRLLVEAGAPAMLIRDARAWVNSTERWADRVTFGEL